MGSSLEDWPISYDDLEPFYSKAEWEIGVSGTGGANPFEAKRQKAYPMPALPFNTEAILWPGRRGAWVGIHFRSRWRSTPSPIKSAQPAYNARTAWGLRAR